MILTRTRGTQRDLDSIIHRPVPVVRHHLRGTGVLHPQISIHTSYQIAKTNPTLTTIQREEHQATSIRICPTMVVVVSSAPAAVAAEHTAGVVNTAIETQSQTTLGSSMGMGTETTDHDDDDHDHALWTRSSRKE